MESHAHFRLRPECEVCGSQSRATALSRPFNDPTVLTFLQTYYAGAIDESMLAGAQYEIARCNACSFHWQFAILKDHGLKALYEQWIDARASCDKRRSGELSIPAAYAKEMVTVGAFARKAPSDIRVLDHGMGWGYWCRMAIAFGFEAHGTEMSVERRNHAAGMGVIPANIETLPTAYFDFINSEQSFEHIPRPTENLRKLAAALRPGGVVRIAVPDAEASIQHLQLRSWSASKDALHPLEHINAFTHRSLERLGKEAGLRPVQPPTFPMLAGDVRAVLRGFLRAVRKSHTTTMYFQKS
jgi:SAM-dependent methyltransferase